MKERIILPVNTLIRNNIFLACALSFSRSRFSPPALSFSRALSLWVPRGNGSPSTALNVQLSPLQSYSNLTRSFPLTHTISRFISEHPALSVFPYLSPSPLHLYLHLASFLALSALFPIYLFLPPFPRFLPLSISLPLPSLNHSPCLSLSLVSVSACIYVCLCKHVSACVCTCLPTGACLPVSACVCICV